MSTSGFLRTCIKWLSSPRQLMIAVCGILLVILITMYNFDASDQDQQHHHHQQATNRPAESNTTAASVTSSLSSFRQQQSTSSAPTSPPPLPTTTTTNRLPTTTTTTNPLPTTTSTSTTTTINPLPTTTTTVSAKSPRSPLPSPTTSPRNNKIDRGGPEPLRCEHSESLDQSPAMIKTYGPAVIIDKTDNMDKNSNVVASGWCELVSAPSSSAEPNKNEEWSQYYRSVFDNESTNNKSGPNVHYGGGSTFVSYKEFSDEDGSWPYYQCPVKHRIRCGDISSRNSDQKQKKKNKTKALVIYAATSGSNVYQHHQETNNYNFFLQHGLIPADTQTALFDAVDFAIIKVQIANEKRENETIECGTAAEAMEQKKGKHDDEPNFSNVRFMMAPKVPCDLCADLYVLDKIGLFNLTREQEIIERSKMKVTAKKKVNSKKDAYYDDDKDPPLIPGTGSMYSYIVHELSRSSYRQDMLFGDEKVDEMRDNNNNNNNKTFENDDEYSYVVLMNSGVRGPFFNSADDEDNNEEKAESNNHPQKSRRHPKTTWIDFVAMAGRRRIPNPRLGFFDAKSKRRPQRKKSRDKSNHRDDYDNDDFDCPTHVSTSATISWMYGVHHQSFFMGMPIEMFRKRMYPLFASVCPGMARTAVVSPSKKWQKLACVIHGEVKTGIALLNYSSPFAMYSLNRQFYIQDVYGDSQKKEALNSGPRLKSNPTEHWINPCSSVFSKNGGEMFQEKMLHPKLLNAVDKLTKGMSMSASSRQQAALKKGFDFAAINRMFKEKGCQWTL